MRLLDCQRSHPKDELRFGKGGVDDAEVILHEYGHAIHFSQNFSFATEEAGAISEGFGDYWAVTVTNVIAPTPDAPCVADWDSTSYTRDVPHCLRRVDADLHYPRDLVGEVHYDGQIWSRALWDIRQALGHTKADTIILEGQFGFPGTSMPDLARATVDGKARSDIIAPHPQQDDNRRRRCPIRSPARICWPRSSRSARPFWICCRASATSSGAPSRATTAGASTTSRRTWPTRTTAWR